MRMMWAGVCLGIILCLSAACNRIHHNEDAVLEYRLEAVPGEGWFVEARFEGLGRRKPRLRMLSSWGSFPSLGAKIFNLKATTASGTRLPVEQTDDGKFAVWKIGTRVEGPLVVRYQVKPYGPFESPEATFVSAEEAMALGYCVFMVPDEITDYLPVSISVSVDTPWRTWTSWRKEEVFHPETAHDLWSAVVIAGDLQELCLAQGKTRVTVLTDRSWASHLGSSVANRLFPALHRMREVFGAAPRQDSLDVLALFRSAPPNDRRSFMVGVSEAGCFLCLATPDRFQNLTGIAALATHECLHFYLGEALVAEAEPPFQNNPDMIWFFEGMTEYLSYRFMLEAGVLTDGELDGIQNVKASKMERRALSGLRLADAARMFQWPEVYELIYNKGYFLAQYLDEYMEKECGPGSLDAALRKVFEQHNFYRTHQPLEQEALLAVFAGTCPGSADWIRLHMIQNVPLPGKKWVETQKATPEGAAHTR